MDFSIILLTILGLSLFEIVSSIDNAIINAEVLSKMEEKARRWFLFWGILTSVFLVRGALPILLIWVTTPEIGLIGALAATFSNDPKVIQAIEESSPILLVGGGIFLIFTFFDWLFLEEKHYGLPYERFFHAQGAWFYTIVSVLLLIVIWFSINIHPLIAFGAAFGSTVFFINHGFRQYAEKQEKNMMGKRGMSNVSKIIYLEVIDASFSIDGVIGAFAFTLSPILIFLGNGIGAIVLRHFTVRGIQKIAKYKYLKNGAMYSILFLGTTMLLDSFGLTIPQWISPVFTFLIVGFFFFRSKNNAQL